MNIFKKILKKLAKASLPIFSFDNNELNFQIDSNDMLSYKIENFDFKTRHDPYVLDGYTIKTRDIFVEHIKLESDSSWNGEAYGIFKSFIKDKLNLKNMQLLKEMQFENYTFTIYNINDEYILYFIHIFEMNKNTFLIDTKGDLFNTIISALDETYVDVYKNENKTEVNFDVSLIKANGIFSYFGHMHG
ncbi:MAG: hypothetical protein ACNI3C_12435 [Candidatus Marinarcus sp.]|uniref:hypothetical protein n=1 Tax=Candidatus Marinarcus sp. TaxID=3100987 RepID=UPI003B002178